MDLDMNLKKLQASADDACRLIKVLSNRERMMLLCQIGRGEKCVRELEGCLDIRQPTLSQQLAVLRNEDLVKTRREGRKIYYSLSSHVALAVIRVLNQDCCS